MVPFSYERNCYNLHFATKNSIPHDRMKKKEFFVEICRDHYNRQSYKCFASYVKNAFPCIVLHIQLNFCKKGPNFFNIYASTLLKLSKNSHDIRAASARPGPKIFEHFHVCKYMLQNTKCISHKYQMHHPQIPNPGSLLPKYATKSQSGNFAPGEFDTDIVNYFYSIVSKGTKTF